MYFHLPWFLLAVILGSYQLNVVPSDFSAIPQTFCLIPLQKEVFYLLWPSCYSDVEGFHQRSYEIVTINHFNVRHKNRPKHNQHLQVLLFYVYLHIKLTIYLEKNKSNSHKQYSFGIIFSKNPKKGHIDQVYYKFFSSVWKQTTPKPSKVATAKNFLSSVYAIVTACFDKYFLFHLMTERHFFIYYIFFISYIFEYYIIYIFY